LDTLLKELHAEGKLQNVHNTKAAAQPKIENARKQKILEKLTEGSKRIEAIANEHNLKDLSPLGLELAKLSAIEKANEKVRQKVDQAFLDFKVDLQAAVPPGSVIKYRGSLATGWKSWKPGQTLKDAARMFDANSFDCDAFIEVPENEWQNIVTLYPELNNKGAEFLDVLTEWSWYKKLIPVRNKIAEELAKITGYKKRPGTIKADFTFKVQTSQKTKQQEHFGNPVPEGAVEKAGYPEYEETLEQTTLPENIDPSKGSGRKLPTKAHEVVRF
jgi:hypothetical protein